MKAKLPTSKVISTLPRRLHHAVPAVILGTLFNVLDTVSIGILIFPATDGAFKTHQLQGLSMFIMSTLTSQVAMTLGGSRFPGALGAMLMEILPFLRGIASDIRSALGDDHPGLIPTVMAAYALTSFLTGLVFIVLGLLRLGTVVAYFPQTVLTGAIGAIGVSLFVLGLGLPFPPSATPLSLRNVSSTLFAKSHLSLLAASFFPAFILSLTLRSQFFQLWTRGLARSAYYIPIYLLCIPAVFWVTVGSSHISKEHLIAAGWLFSVDSASTSSSGVISSWNYWTLFNFRLVEWRSLHSALQNIVLLVVIGVLNLPIFVPSLAISLEVTYDMNHELLGQGAANILAGLVGTVPNILQFSYSVYVTRAKGGRFELWFVILLTGGLFLSAGSLLPYVPTTLASTMVLFLGIELFLGATWEATSWLTGMEWAVVVGTLAACTFIGFAEGFGVGIGVATVVYLVYGVIDSPARTRRWNDWDTVPLEKSGGREGSTVPPPSPQTQMDANTAPRERLHCPSVDTRTVEDPDLVNARVVVLSGYIFFASVPSMEKALLESKVSAELIILDVARAYRIESTAARCLSRCVRELALKKSTLIICGLMQNSGLHADFIRAQVPLVFDGADSVGEREIRVFATRRGCLAWCRLQRDTWCMQLENEPSEMDRQAMENALSTFRGMFGFNSTMLGTAVDETHTDGTPSSELDRFVKSGGHIVAYFPGHVIDPGIAFVVEGDIFLTNPRPTREPSAPVPSPARRPSIRDSLTMIPREVARIMSVALSTFSKTWPRHTRTAGDVIDLRCASKIAVAATRCVVVQIEGGALGMWAEGRLGGLIQTV